MDLERRARGRDLLRSVSGRSRARARDPGHRVGHGTTFGDGGAAIRVGLGRDTPASFLANDWVMTHEMVHLAIPEIGDDHEWLTEGIPTYVEPLGRAQAGQIRPEKVWADLVWGLPKGLPDPGDRGLDHMPTWGRTYWGARSSVCSPISRPASGRPDERDYRMRCAPSSLPAATSSNTGRSSAFSTSAIVRPECPSSGRCTIT